MKEKKCRICGELFVPECSSNLICKREHHTNCPICGKDMIWNTTSAVQPCSKECKREQTKRNNILKYGVEHPMQSKEVQKHHRQAMLEKYGVESPLQSAELKQKAINTNQEKFGTNWALSNKNVKKKAMDTMTAKYGGKTTLESPMLRKRVEETLINRYGVDNPMKMEDVNNKASNTCFLKYSVSNPMQFEEFHKKAFDSRIKHYGSFWAPEIAERAKQTFVERYGVDNPSRNPEIIAKIKSTFVERYGEDYGKFLLRNTVYSNISNINKAFMTALEAHGLSGEYEFSGVMRYRYDIEVTDQKTLIELDPTYTHNAIGNHWTSEGTPKDYHIRKSLAATQAGYRCIHVFDWDDWDKIIELLTPKQKIYARQCTVYKLNSKVADEFLNRYHLQGTVKNQIVNLGLVKDGELMQVMTFGSPRFSKKHDSELLRLCTKSGYMVLGGAEKLFKFATDQLGIDNIISYCDLSKFKGDVYSRIGMTLIRNTEPQEIWSRGDRKITANLLRQRGFDQLFNTNYGKGTSNEELMIRDGWLPVYDCGQAVYEYRNVGA